MIFKPTAIIPDRNIKSVLVLVWFGSLAWSGAFAQSSLSGFRKEADRAFDRGQYYDALQNYRQAGMESSHNKDIRLRIAICQYEANEVDGALRQLVSLEAGGKTDPEVYYYLARSYEAKNLFAEATAAYKKYLQHAKPNDHRRDFIKDQLYRDANGLRLKYAEQTTFVENAGPAVNTRFNEFGVKPSPNIAGKIYFNSDRPRGRDETGHSDIYAILINNGKWEEASLLPQHINSATREEVLGFTQQGQILYYLSQVSGALRVRTDTFSTIEGKWRKGFFKGPFDPATDGDDLVFFDDTICLFSSDRPGGYGGYDLYISFFQKNSWGAALNLGPVINTFYDERYPFLTLDGLELFYASNSLASMGGYDVFKTSYDPAKRNWTFPENMGIPVNSSGDDTRLVLSTDGVSAFLNSNRKDGFGGEDIYRVFFKTPTKSYVEESAIADFHRFLLSENKNPGTEPVPEKPPAVKEYYISHLFYEDANDVLTPQNLKKLELLVNLLQVYPNITAELSAFELPEGQKTYNVYYSIKKAEEAASFIIQKGISPDRILLKGYGSSFPLARIPEGMKSNPLYARLNQRVEITLHRYRDQPLILHTENIPVPDILQDERGQKFTSVRHGFYFSVQFASVQQILQSPILEMLDEVFIEENANNGTLNYLAGMFTDFEDADAAMTDLRKKGFADARIIPYLNGVRIRDNQLEEYVNTYPDLLLYRDYLARMR